MTEAAVTAIISILSGLGIVTQRLHNRLSELDRKIDSVHLQVAKNYVAKTDLSEITDRIEQHMVRIENKLDRIIIK